MFQRNARKLRGKFKRNRNRDFVVDDFLDLIRKKLSLKTYGSGKTALFTHFGIKRNCLHTSVKKIRIETLEERVFRALHFLSNASDEPTEARPQQKFAPKNKINPQRQQKSI